ncbi:MAG: glycosyltransferase family 2 protein [Pseudomonadota bacterium]
MSLQISIITAVLNRSETLAEALRSVRDQTWGNIEHIVVDGGSTDGTLAVVEQYKAGISQFVSSPDNGPYDALNKGIALATGDIVGFMHADDSYGSTNSLQQVARAFEDPAVGAVYGDLVYVGKKDPSRIVRYWQGGPYQRERLTQGWMPPHPTLYVRRELYTRYGAFDTRFRIAADYDHMLRLLWRGRVNAAYIPEVLVRMRMGGLSNGSLPNMFRKSREDYRAMRENGIGGFQTLLMKNVTKLPQFMVRPAAAR